MEQNLLNILMSYHFIIKKYSQLFEIILKIWKNAKLLTFISFF